MFQKNYAGFLIEGKFLIGISYATDVHKGYVFGLYTSICQFVPFILEHIKFSKQDRLRNFPENDQSIKKKRCCK